MGKDAAKSSKEKKHFWKDFKAELKKVIWPTPKQVVNNTVAVITIVVITAVIVFVLDLAFEALNTYGIDKIRSLVTNTENVQDTVEENAENEEGNIEEENAENVEGNVEEENTENTEGNAENNNAESTDVTEENTDVQE